MAARYRVDTVPPGRGQYSPRYYVVDVETLKTQGPPMENYRSAVLLAEAMNAETDNEKGE